MDKGMRKILIILGVFCLISLISAVRFFQMERATHQRYLKAKAENVELDEKVSLLGRERSKLVRRLETVSKELKEISREEKKLREKYSSLLNEKEKLSMQVGMLTREKEGLDKKISEMESEGFLGSLLKEKTTLEVKVKNLEKKLKKVSSLKQELEVVTKAKSALEEQLAREKEVSEYLSKDFLKEKQERLTVTSRLDEIEKEKKELEITLDRAKGERASLEKELVRLLDKARDERTSLEKELAMLRRELETSEQEREELTTQIVDMERILEERLAEVNLVRSRLKEVIRKSRPKREETVELPPIVVRAKTPSSPTPTQPQKIVVPQVTQTEELTGKIMTINEEHNFVVIDLGSNDGLEVGIVFDVYRDNKEIARIRVVETREQIAVADVISVESRTKIRPGDTIIKE